MTEEQREAKKQYLRDRRRKLKEDGLVEVRAAVKRKHKAECEEYLKQRGDGQHRMF